MNTEKAMKWYVGLTIAAVLALLLAVYISTRPAQAQTPPPPPCQTIFLPDGRMIICCTTGSVTTCM